MNADPLELANELMARGDAAGALEHYERHHARSPRDWEGLRGRGLALLALDRHAEAYDWLKKATWTRARDSETQGALAVCAYRLNRHKEAVIAWRSALRTSADHFRRYPEQREPWLDARGHYREFDEIVRRVGRRPDLRDYAEALSLLCVPEDVPEMLATCSEVQLSTSDQGGSSILHELLRLLPPRCSVLDGSPTFSTLRQVARDDEEWSWFVDQLLLYCGRVTSGNLDHVLLPLIRTRSADITRMCYQRAPDGSESHAAAVLVLSERLVEALEAVTV